MPDTIPQSNELIENLKKQTGHYGVAFSMRPLAHDEGTVHQIAVTLVSDNRGWEITGDPDKLGELFRAIAGRIEATWGIKENQDQDGPLERNSYIIHKDDDRYPGIDRNMPKDFSAVGLTREQADWVAERLSNHNAGCDYSWYVPDGDTGE